MAYSEFTLRLLKERFGITASDADDLFADIPPLPSFSDFFHTLLKRHLPIVRGQGTEKARSEMIIAPLLVELREQSGHQIAVFSGVEMTGDSCSRTCTDSAIFSCPARQRLCSPSLLRCLTVVEAKREDLTAGVAQCIAEMYAAALFNARDGEPREVHVRCGHERYELAIFASARPSRRGGSRRNTSLKMWTKYLGILRYMTLS